jgi:hypothetical protein
VSGLPSVASYAQERPTRLLDIKTPVCYDGIQVVINMGIGIGTLLVIVLIVVLLVILL